jgi:hypothetical protein
MQKKNSIGYILIQFQLEKTSGGFISIDKMWGTTGTQEEKTLFINNIIAELFLKDSGYTDVFFSAVNFHGFYRDGDIPSERVLTGGFTKRKSDFTTVSHYKIPGFNNPFLMGRVLGTPLTIDDSKRFTVFAEGNKVFQIEMVPNEFGFKTNNIEVFKDGLCKIRIQDIQKEANTFERIILGKYPKKYLYSIDGKMLLVTNSINTNFMQELKPDLGLGDKVGVFDIEAQRVTQDNGRVIFKPYLICIYYNNLDATAGLSFFLGDHKDECHMFKEAFKSILRRKFNGYTFNCHNLSNFDSNFILKYIFELAEASIVFRDGRIISITLNYGTPINGKYPYRLYIQDSIQKLPSSLKKLGLSFNTNIKKDVFPHSFVDTNKLDYVGPVPSMEFFPLDTFSSVTEYNSYVINNFPYHDWNLKKESIKYCQLDCISLHQVLIKFSQLIWDKYHINITKFPTLTSLTFSIFRAHFLGNNKIPMLAGQFYNDIKQAYTGGATDMFIPTNLLKNNISSSSILSKVFKNAWKVICILYYYDVNSLYPYIMSQFELPCGKIVYFEGNIYDENLIINNIIPQGVLGFYYCKVIAPTNLLHPIIQLRHNNTTLAPLGSFECMLYSKEIENARKYGYDIQVLRGYYFTEKAYLFKDYIKQLYEFRLTYDKSHPMNLIAKLLMNSLYGRFGMDFSLENTTIVNNIEINDMLNSKNNINGNIIDVEPLGKNNFIVTRDQPFYANINDKMSSLSHHHNINVGVAAAITALARIYMSKFKNNPLIKLFYTDTDSIFTDKSPVEMNTIFNDIIGNKLGQLKLECVINRAVFLAPKAYCLELVNQEQIIKIKGLNSNVIKNLMGEQVLTLDTFIKVLSMDSVEIVNQHKTIKNLLDGSLDIIEQAYTI